MGNNRRNSIMKRIILFAFALMLSAATFAQQQLATLNHNNNITTYYGVDALISAHADAVNGDIITLSGGMFDATDITKAVTIRGAGAWGDATSSITMIGNDFKITIPEESTYHFTMEGIYVLNTVRCMDVHNPQFIKCHFQTVCNNYYTGHWTETGTMYDASFIYCILVYWDNYYNSNIRGTQFINSVVMSAYYYRLTNDTYINCVVRQDPIYAASRMFQNCVLYWDYTSANTPSDNSSTSFNCLFVQMNSDESYTDELFAPLAGHELWNIRGMGNVFKSFDGTNGDNFELLNSVASSYLGTDGTQIGIYGGPMPFDPHVTNPLIRRINVASRSTSDGKLPVDIEVVDE